MGRVRRLLSRFMVGVAVSGPVLVSCGADQASLCDQPSSVAGFVLAFDQGLGNVEADQFFGLRIEAGEVRTTLALVLGDPDAPAEVDVAARTLDDMVSEFEDRMAAANWDVTVGLADGETAVLVDRFAASGTLTAANLVEAHVIDRCGLPPIVPSDSDTADSLPGPSVPSPTATDPPTDTIDERSEARSLGTTVGEIYGLTLDDEQVVCLGLALEGVYDVSGSATSPEKYQRQFQSAFDRCDIDFVVPGA